MIYANMPDSATAIVYILYNGAYYIGETRNPRYRYTQVIRDTFLSTWCEPVYEQRCIHEKEFIQFCLAIGLPLGNKQLV